MREAADLRVIDVGNLFENELLYLGADESLEDEAGARVHAHVITDTDELVFHGLGELNDRAPRRRDPG